MDIINIKKDNKIILTVGMKYTLGYDNYQWYRIANLIKALSNGKDILQEECYLLDKEDGDNAEVLIDLDNNMVSGLPCFPLYEFEEVNKDNCCIEIIKKRNNYYSYNSDSEEEVLMPHVSFKDEELLIRKNGVYSFDEVNTINEFIESLLKYDGLSDFILNNKHVIRLNII